ncbi:MAG: DegT/DnrJ/EryC1/StrS family aminotransferase [Cyclobacteriaceae bacterium]
MQVSFVDLKAQYNSIKPEIDAAIHGILDNTSFIGGPIVKEFEENFSRYCGTNHCVNCANGTDAIEIALQALGIGTGDEVIVPAMSWIATSEAVTTVGATPVFADILPTKWTIDPEEVKKKITAKTKAIIPVHFYGKPAEMAEIMEIAQENGLKVIEDSAQAHGAAHAGQPIGTFGNIATFSFYPGKNLGAYGDAGAIVTNDEKLAEKCRKIGNHGQLQKHDHLLEGRNSRMDTIQAAVLNVKLKYLEEWTERRINHAKYYNEELSGLDFTLPEINHDRHVFHVYVVNFENRDQVKTELLNRGISTQLHYPNALPMLKPYASINNPDDYPVAGRLANCGLSLPLYPEIPREQIDYVVKCLSEIL